MKANTPWIFYGGPACLLIAALCGVWSIPAAINHHAPAGLYVTAFWLAGGLFFSYLYLLSPKRLLRNSRIHALPVHGWLDDSRVVVESEVNRTDLAWNRLHSANVTDRSLLLYTARYVGLHLHKSFFQDSDDWASAVALAQTRLPHGRAVSPIGIPKIWFWFMVVAVCVIVLWNALQAL